MITRQNRRFTDQSANTRWANNHEILTLSLFSSSLYFFRALQIVCRIRTNHCQLEEREIRFIQEADTRIRRWCPKPVLQFWRAFGSSGAPQLGLWVSLPLSLTFPPWDSMSYTWPTSPTIFLLHKFLPLVFISLWIFVLLSVT